MATKDFEIKGNSLLKYTGNGKKVVTPDEVKYIDSASFARLGTLDEVVFGPNVEKYGLAIFQETHVKRLVFTTRPKRIDKLSLALANGFDEIVIPKSMERTFDQYKPFQIPEVKVTVIDNSKKAAKAAAKKGSVAAAKGGLSYALGQYAEYPNGLRVPVPDGYHYQMGGEGENANWCYAVPGSVSLDESHINAKPYSFALSIPAVASLPENLRSYPLQTRVERIKSLLLAKGILDLDVIVSTEIAGGDKAFLYQSWVDYDDLTYNKINGFLLVGNALHQFHAYANHDEKIAGKDEVVDAVIKLVTEWMDHFGDGEAANDSSEANEEAPLTIAQMRKCVDNFSRLIDQSDVVSAKSSQIDLMKEMLIKAGGLLYKNKNTEIDDEAVEVISDVVGTYKGGIVDSSVIEEVVGYDRGDDPKSFVNYEMKYIISPVFIMIDKAARVEYHEGCTSLYQFVVTDLLHALCDKLGVDFKKDEFCCDLLSALDELITAKWKSVISF